MNAPASDGRIVQKLWGTTQRVLLTPKIQIEHICGRAGAASSLHLHQHRHNYFVVLSGCLRIEVLADQEHAVRLNRGRSLLVHAGILHRMVFVEDSEAVEIYFTDGPPVDPEDIRRLSPGWRCQSD